MQAGAALYQGAALMAKGKEVSCLGREAKEDQRELVEKCAKELQKLLSNGNYQCAVITRDVLVFVPENLQKDD